MRKSSLLWASLGLLASIRLCWSAIHQSGEVDLQVYWQAVHVWLQGISPYIPRPHQEAIVFKYPPWTLPVFLPLGFASFELTRWLWVFFQCLAILYCIRWARRAGVSLNVACVVTGLFWWIWLGHAMAGQVTLFILVVALWAVPPEEDRALSPPRLAALALCLSTKVFNLFSLLGIARSVFRARTLMIGALVFALLNAAALTVFAAHGNSISLIGMYRAWMEAAASGGDTFGAAVIRGPGNHGFTAVLLRLFRVPASESRRDIEVALLLGAVFSYAWFRFSTELSRAEKWAGWIAVGTVIHPLLWHHSFVLVYPVCALSLDRTIRSGRRRLIALSLAGIFFIGIWIPNLFGPAIVNPIELLGSKSWGVVFSCVALVLAQRAQRDRQAQRQSTPQSSVSVAEIGAG